MKIESLAIIFVIIIIPIALVLSEYVDNKITIAETELKYDTRLLTSTQDAITAFQISNVNNAYSDILTSKVKEIEEAANTFLNSLAINFGYSGYKSGTMKEYVPAIVFTLYDGYYIYAPFKNTLTTTSGETLDVDEAYKDGKILYGLKPYIYYSCRYKQEQKYDFVVTYTLDNYITVQGIVGGNYVYKYGYLIKGISHEGTKLDTDDEYNVDIYDTYKYQGIKFSNSDSDAEVLKEHVGDTEYAYAKINGVKYYLEDENSDFDNAKIFYIDNTGKKNYSQFASNENYRKKLFDAIKEGNKSAYEYYKDAYGFTTWVNKNLKTIKTSDAVAIDSSGNTTSISEEYKFGNNQIFGENIDYEKSTSTFNEHRKAVIRYVVETNLSASISAFSSNAGGTDFIMPKISETDWDLIENDVCIIGFMQGLSMGAKRYNSYAVVPNTLSKEYVDENDIYILTTDGYYSKANDSNLNDTNIQSKDTNNNYYAGIWKINFEKKRYVDDSDITRAYYPNKSLGSYTSIVGSSGLGSTGITGKTNYTDMYDYIANCENYTLKKAYFMALARERWGSYHVNNNLDLKYFLDAY